LPPSRRLAPVLDRRGSPPSAYRQLPPKRGEPDDHYRQFTVIVAAIAALCLPGQLHAHAKEPVAGTQEARGQVVYARWCAACHDPGPEHPGTLAIGVKYKGAVPAALIDRTDLAPELTKSVVRNGMYSMAFFRKTEISDAELDDLAAYLARNSKR
jgi:mono/diheme cytochrome c family protein